MTLLLAIACSFATQTSPVEDELTGFQPIPGPSERPVLFERAEDGHLWALGANWKASFGADGVMYVPLTRSPEATAAPVRFQLKGARVGDHDLRVTAPTSITQTDSRVEMEHGGLRQAWNVSPYELEQTFILDELPASGDLVISIEVNSELAAQIAGEELHLKSDLGDVKYGAAIAFDGTGRRVGVQRTATHNGFELRVPQTFLDGASLPLVVDPIVSNTFNVPPGAHTQRQPAAAFGRAKLGTGRRSAYMVIWEELPGGNDRDLISVEYTSSGDVIPGTLRAIDITSSRCQSPRVAFNRPNETWMVVYERVHLGGINADIIAQRSALNSTDAWTHWSILSGFGAGQKSNPDVGGFDGHGSDLGHAFTVIWEESIAGKWKIRGRQLLSTGAAMTGILEISQNTNHNRYPRISQGAGEPFFGAYWQNMVWVKDPQNSVGSSVRARRITTKSSTMTQAVTISQGGRCYTPSPSETLGTHTHPDGSLPFMVAYKYEGPVHEYIYTCDVGNAGLASGVPLSLTEGLAQPLRAVSVSVAGTGLGATVAYAATDGGSSTSLRASSGNFSKSNNAGNFLFGLGERAVDVANDLANWTEYTFASEAEGGGAQDRGAFFWFSGNGTIRGALYDGPSTLTDPILGVQSCTSIPNSTGERGWVSAYGMPDVVSPKSLIAESLPPHQFGFMLVGETHGFGHPAGSNGRICIGGLLGRYLGQIQSSGVDGRMSFTIRPTTIAQPNGTVAAAPGENYYFQVWHRDSDGGVPTSNLTNALEISFQ